MRRAILALAFLIGTAGSAAAAPPTIVCPGPQATYESGGVSFVVTASDPDGDPVVLRCMNPPWRAVFVASDIGQFQWVPDYNQAGDYTIVFHAVAGADSVSCTVPIHVDNLDRAPTLKCPPLISGVVGDTIRTTLAGYDPDHDPLTYSGSPLPAGATLSPAGLFTWPTAEATQGTYRITVQVSDGIQSAECVLTIQLAGNAPSPIIQCPGPQTVGEFTALQFDILAADPLGMPVTLSAVGLPAGATFTPSSGRFRWTPSLSQAGAYSPRFVASNGQSTDATCTVPITVTNLPVSPPYFTVCPGTTTSIETQLIQFQVRASDPQGYQVFYSATGVPPGAVFSNPTGGFFWTPSIGQAGSYTLVITASNTGASSTCTVQMNVGAYAVLPPVLSCPGAQSVPERVPLQFNVLATDPQSLPVTLTLANPPAGSTFTTTAGAYKQFRWTPGPDQSGVYALRFNAANAQAASACTVSVAVIDRPLSPPHITCPADIVVPEQRRIQFRAAAIDPEGDPITYFARALPAGATLGADGTFLWVPGAMQSGIHHPEFIASDGEGRDSCTVTIEVLDHPAALGGLDGVIARAADVRGDQGGWLRMLIAAAPNDDPAPGYPVVTGYELWRRIAGPRRLAAATVGTESVRAGLARPGSVLDAGGAEALGFPDGAWEAVGYTPALQAINFSLLAPTRDDSSAAGRPFEVFVLTTHTGTPAVWAVSAPESAYSVDDLAPAAPVVIAARAEGGATKLAWHVSPDPDVAHYTIYRAAGADFDPVPALALGDTPDSAWVDAAPPGPAWYRVVAVDVHGNASGSTAIAGPSPPVIGVVALSPPRPNPSRSGIAFDVALPAAGEVSLSIVDARGRLVRLVHRGELEAGYRAFTWDGLDAQGRRAPIGLYVLELKASGTERARKFVLTR